MKKPIAGGGVAEAGRKFQRNNRSYPATLFQNIAGQKSP